MHVDSEISSISVYVGAYSHINTCRISLSAFIYVDLISAVETFTADTVFIKP